MTGKAYMKRGVTSKKALVAYHIICSHPNGISRGDLCKELGILSGQIDGLLAGLEGTAMLISESNGWCYKFNKEDECL